MAIKFSKVEGAAKKSDVKYMNLIEGENRFRMVGDVLPRYMYWVRKGKVNAAFECLAFNRDLEKFTNTEKDWVPEMVEHFQAIPRKEVRCAWGYCVQVIDRADGKLKVLNLKKKMFEAIKSIAKDLGDPTDADEGYDIIVERRKTGPHEYNVEYEVKQIRMMKEKGKPMPESDRDILSSLRSIEDLIPRQTAADQKAALENLLSTPKEEDSASDAEAIDELE